MIRSRTTAAKQSAVVDRATLDRQRGAIERYSAFVVLFFSFAGTIAALSGGWSALRDAPQLAPIVAGLALQACLTATQWWYGAGRGPWRYRLALCADSALTALGYGPLIVPWLSTYLAAKGAGQASEIASWIIVGVASLLVACYRERKLIV